MSASTPERCFRSVAGGRHFRDRCRPSTRKAIAAAERRRASSGRPDWLSTPCGPAVSAHSIPIGNVVGTERAHSHAMSRSGKSLRVGLPVAPVVARTVGGRPYLLVTRDDRRFDAGGQAHRLHQEDFCQALGIVPERNYAAEGGPTFKIGFDLLRRATTVPTGEREHRAARDPSKSAFVERLLAAKPTGPLDDAALHAPEPGCDRRGHQAPGVRNGGERRAERASQRDRRLSAFALARSPQVLRRDRLRR
jgi:hypothetical protein